MKNSTAIILIGILAIIVVLIICMHDSNIKPKEAYSVAHYHITQHIYAPTNYTIDAVNGSGNAIGSNNTLENSTPHV